MEKDRGAKAIAIVALMVGVVGLTLGFAAFTNTLTIKPEATVSPDANVFNVDFSNENAVNKIAVSEGGVAPSASSTGTGENAVIDNSAAGAPVISNLKATFTEPNQTVVYEFYTKNVGELKAYLTSVAFNDVTTGNYKVCEKVTVGKESDEIATDGLVAAACDGISLSFKLGSETFTVPTSASTVLRANFSPSQTAHDLVTTGSEKVTVTITYADGSTQADGDFTVTFGDIVLSYTSAEPA